MHYSDETELHETHTAQRHGRKMLLRFTGLVTLVIAQYTMHSTISAPHVYSMQSAGDMSYDLAPYDTLHFATAYSCVILIPLLAPKPYGKWISFVDVQVLLLEWTWISASPSSLILIQTPIANSASNFRTQYNTLLINYTTQQDPLHYQLYDHANTPIYLSWCGEEMTGMCLPTSCLLCRWLILCQLLNIIIIMI